MTISLATDLYAISDGPSDRFRQPYSACSLIGGPVALRSSKLVTNAPQQIYAAQPAAPWIHHDEGEQAAVVSTELRSLGLLGPQDAPTLRVDIAFNQFAHILGNRIHAGGALLLTFGLYCTLSCDTFLAVARAAEPALVARGLAGELAGDELVGLVPVSESHPSIRSAPTVRSQLPLLRVAHPGAGQVFFQRASTLG